MFFKAAFPLISLLQFCSRTPTSLMEYVLPVLASESNKSMKITREFDYFFFKDMPYHNTNSSQLRHTDPGLLN